MLNPGVSLMLTKGVSVMLNPGVSLLLTKGVFCHADSWCIIDAD